MTQQQKAEKKEAPYEKQRVGFQIKTISNLIRRELNKSQSHKCADSMTGTHGWVIRYLMINRDRDIFQRDLEENFSIRRSTASNILKLMEKNGLIRREPVESDGRLKKLVPTEKAIKLHNMIEEDIEKMETKMTAGIESSELEAFMATLSKIRDNLEK